MAGSVGSVSGLLFRTHSQQRARDQQNPKAKKLSALNSTLGTKTENSELNSTLGGKRKLQLALPHELARQQPRGPRNWWRQAPRHPGIGGGGEVAGDPKSLGSAAVSKRLIKSYHVHDTLHTAQRMISSMNSSLTSHRITKTERQGHRNPFKLHF